MKNILTTILLIVSFTISKGQQSETRQLGSFRAVKASEGIDVYLKQGDKESARVEVNDISLENVMTEVVGTYLKVHMREGSHRTKSVKVYVTYVAVDKLSASSAANIYSEGKLEAKDLDLSVSSAGSIELTVESTNVEASASSAGQIDIKGKTDNLSLDASSAGQIDAYDLKAETVRAQASSAGSLKLTATKELDGNASSGGSVRYRGNPAKTMTNSSSGGSVKKSD